MTADFLCDAIGDIREDLIEDAEVFPYKPRGRVIRNMIAACLILSLIVIPVSAEMRTGYISNLLAPLYGNAQTELVDSVGVPIGASCTANGYTLTADAVIGDKYNMAVVYSLEREDGGVLPGEVHFANWETHFTEPTGWMDILLGTGSGGGSLSYIPSEDGKSMKIIEQWSSSNVLLRTRRHAHVRFSGLEIWDPETYESTPLLEGTWELDFTIRYKVKSKLFWAHDFEVVDQEGNKFTVHRGEISPFGVNLRLTVPNARFGKPLLIGEIGVDFTEEEFQDQQPKMFKFAVKKKDGTIVNAGTSNCNSGGSLSKPTHKGHFQGMLDEPVPLEDIAALLFFSTEYPVDLS